VLVPFGLIIALVALSKGLTGVVKAVGDLA
jgi:hypothetical protein